MSLLTNWGYSLTEATTLDNLLSVDEYATITGRSDDEERVTEEISAASAAVRNFVGWHLAPSYACSLSTIVHDRRVTQIGPDLLIQLPARYVTALDSVTIGGTEWSSYYLDPNGLLRLFDVGHLSRKAVVSVEYSAGLDDELLAPIMELIAHRVTHAMAVPAGITSEASGGVSVTYNANWINNARATALAGDNKELLIPYRVTGVF